MKELIAELRKQNLTIVSCESLTGGLFATQLTELNGVGKLFKGGFIVYSNESKSKLVKIPSILLEKYGAISQECAEAMVINTQQILNTDLAISFTGNAGPTAQENKPVGLVYIGLALQDKLISKSYQFSGSRSEVRQQAIKAGVELIKDLIFNPK